MQSSGLTAEGWKAALVFRAQCHVKLMGMTFEDPAPKEELVRVLLVEDDEAVADMYRLKLELDGYEVQVAPDGEIAVTMATETVPDLVFLDIRLPKMDGLAVLERLRADERTAAIPVVILSNYSEAELVERGVKLGALDHMIKSQTTPARVADGVPGWLRRA